MTHAGGAAPFAWVEAAPVAASIDRRDDLRADDAALAAYWPGARILIVDADGRAGADASGMRLPLSGAGFPGPVADALFLGVDPAGSAWFAIDPAAAPSVALEHRVDLRAAAADWPMVDAAAFATARATLHWQKRHRYCGACGGMVSFSRGGWLGRCDGCGQDHYPRTDPAVIAAIGDSDRLLLGRQATWPAGRWSVIAGFVEPGESLEQTVAREVLEETGVRVRSCRYVASQPWPFPGALMLGFLGEAEPGAAAQAGEELEDARWFTRADIEAALDAEARGAPGEGPFLLPSRISIAHCLVREWLASRSG